MYTDLINLINEILNNGYWGLVLLPFCLMSFLFATKVYEYSVRPLGNVACIFAVIWAANVPVLAFLPIAILGYTVFSVMYAVVELSYLLATMLAIPAILIFGMPSFAIVVGLFMLPECVAEKIESTNSLNNQT